MVPRYFPDILGSFTLDRIGYWSIVGLKINRFSAMLPRLDLANYWQNSANFRSMWAVGSWTKSTLDSARTLIGSSGVRVAFPEYSGKGLFGPFTLNLARQELL